MLVLIRYMDGSDRYVGNAVFHSDENGVIVKGKEVNFLMGIDMGRNIELFVPYRSLKDLAKFIEDEPEQT